MNLLTQLTWGQVPRIRHLSDHFEVRHSLPHHLDGYPLGCETDLRFRCRCSGHLPGDRPVPGCCARMTGEDLRCQECRDWCYRYTHDDGAVKRVFPLAEYTTNLGEQFGRAMRFVDQIAEYRREA